MGVAAVDIALAGGVGNFLVGDEDLVDVRVGREPAPAVYGAALIIGGLGRFQILQRKPVRIEIGEGRDQESRRRLSVDSSTIPSFSKSSINSMVYVDYRFLVSHCFDWSFSKRGDS
jgi:hypothetical protein